MDLESREGTRRARRIIAVGGGKGGVGKSLIAANLGIFLATLGKRVVLLDADLGGANLHTFMGVGRPRVTLADLFDRRVERIEDVVVETGVPGAGLISGEGDPSWIAKPRPDQKLRLLKEVQRLDVDYLVVDLGPGSGGHALDFFLLADVALLVVVPEPTSIENAVRFLKSAFIRRLRRSGLERTLELAAEGDRAFEGGLPAPWDLYAAARQHDPELAVHVLAELQGFRPRLVVNQVRARADEELATQLAQAARRRLGVAVESLGFVETDDAVWLAVRKRRPLLVEHPESVAARGIERLTRRILALETGELPAAPAAPLRPLEEQTHYEVLDVEPTAHDEDIRRAYRRARETYAAESLVVSGLYSDPRLDALHDRCDQAFETLMDASRRRAYDQTIFPEGPPAYRREADPTPPPDRKVTPAAGVPVAPKSGEPAPVEAAPPEPEVGPETPVTGPLLRQVREARGIDLHAISQRTKISIGHLRALEDERFDLLPAAVYVRGFLQEYAKVLRLDVGKGLNPYLERVRAAKAQMEERG